MAPLRRQPSKAHDGSNVKKRGQRTEGSVDNSLDVPGVQKLKSSIRQTKRLLAKDSLASDVRVETERRLKSLEGDLEIALRRRKERNIATKYHKVKFFERKKALRRINQLKKDSDSSSSVQEALFESRVDLNYIQHYPKLERYISLFPTSEKDGQRSDEGQVHESELKRREMRDNIRSKMRSGELNNEPETFLVEDSTVRLSQGKAPNRAHVTNTKHSKTSDGTSTVSADALEGDDFFDGASEDESGEEIDGRLDS